MQIRQGETLSHQGARTHEVCCSSAQLITTNQLAVHKLRHLLHHMILYIIAIFWSKMVETSDFVKSFLTM
jgi:hypothetical protein